MITVSLVSALLLLCLGQAPDAPRRPLHEAAFVGHPVANLQSSDSPMLMPTAVAVSASGQVYVADGVNDRIVEFDSDGSFLASFNSIGSHELSRPLSLKVDNDGNLWIVDTGNRRIVVRSPSGQPVRTIDVPPPADISDLALQNSEVLWLVDNDGHRLIQYDLSSQEFSHYGSRGEARDQFHHPFMAAIGGGGILHVTDAINGRVQAIRDTRTIPRIIGSYGVAPGQFHRPKGIAVDSAGRIIVADGSLGVVQFFAGDGTFLDALRDENGAVLHFESPCGLTLQGEWLYVTELIPGHVRKLRVEVREIKPVPRPQRAPPAQSQPTACTVCHLEWMPHFVTGTATDLATPPVARPEEPYVSRSESCLSCHDGSVVDSRRKVWREHGHRTGVSPTAGMRVPADLPLLDGKLACRTCHSAHTHGGAGQSMEDAVFLRVNKTPDELCVRCHTGYQGEGIRGWHPTSGFSEPLHPELVSAGARFSFNGASTGCLVCHIGHGSAEERLLVPTETADQLCSSCHAQTTATSGEVEWAATHPLNPPLSQQQKSVLDAMGATPTRAGQMACISCHKMHNAPGAQDLLVRPIEGSRLCLECHSSFDAVTGSAHDLSRPDFKLDSTAGCITTGPCAACHGVHQAPRPAVATRVDQEGACMSCHQAGSCAHSGTAEPFLHPVNIPPDLMARLDAFTGRTRQQSRVGSSLTCLSCHDPHGQTKLMLRGPRATHAEALCFECHAETTAVAASFHGKERLGMETSQTECDSCHAVHAPTSDWQGGSWVAPVASARESWSQHCTGCHSAAAGRHDIAFKPHPNIGMSNVVPPDRPGFMPLVDSRGESGAHGAIGCITCHVPHGRAAGGGFDYPDWNLTPPPLIHAAKSMLRPYVAPNLCSSCHEYDGLSKYLYFHRNAQPQLKSPKE